MKKGNNILRIFGGTLLVLAILLCIVYAMLPGIVLKQVNKKLPENLNAEASLGNVELKLLQGYAAIKDLKIAQPPGFGETPLVDAKLAEVKLSLGSLKSDCIVVEHILLKEAEINLIKNKDGVMNVTALPKPKPDAPEPAEPTEPAESQPLLIEHIDLQKVNFSFRDEGIGDQGLDIVLTDINAALEQLRVDPGAEDNEENTANLEVTAQLGQREFPSAPLAVFATLGPIISTNIPSINAAIRLVGFELEPLINYPGLASVLGGNSLDLAVELGLGQEMLDCQITATMDSGQIHKQSIGGSPFSPDYDKDQVLGLVFGRITGVLSGTVSNLANTGMEVAATVADTTTTAVKDAGKAVAGVGKGLFRTIRSVATLDLGGAASNLTDTAVGAVADTANTVTGAATNLTTGVSNAARTAAGSTTSEAFRKEVRSRSEKTFAAAKAWPAEQVFPPQRQFSKSNAVAPTATE